MMVVTKDEDNPVNVSKLNIKKMSSVLGQIQSVPLNSSTRQTPLPTAILPVSTTKVFITLRQTQLRWLPALRNLPL